jgi:hypothetical protein
MKKMFLPLWVLLLTVCFAANAFAADREFYAIQIYNLETTAQEQQVDTYLQNAYLPALHRMGFKNIGVFKPIANDTSSNKRIVVFIPLKKLDQYVAMVDKLAKDKQYLQDGAAYIDAAYNKPAYKRMETVLLRAFTGMPVMEKPALKSSVSDKVYELRSYESATEKLYINKVEMFNKGDEVGLFKRLGFNAVFYAEVLAGSHMPNLMYMTSFENMQEREQHWKAFGSDPAWKVLSAKPEYQHNVSKNDTWLMRATAYSDL